MRLKFTIACVVAAFLLWAVVVFGQVPFGSFKVNSGGITCAATGSSTQVLPANGSRQAYVLTNDSDTSVRIGFLSSGTVTLDDTNSTLLPANGSLSSSPSNIYFGRIVCMSTIAGTKVIHFVEETRQ